MKKFLLILLIALFAGSCGVLKDQYKMSDKEITEKGLRTEKNSVIANDSVVVANVTSVELELYNGKMVQEISVTLTNTGLLYDAEDILRFLHTKYPKSKIEINSDGKLGFE